MHAPDAMEVVVSAFAWLPGRAKDAEAAVRALGQEGQDWETPDLDQATCVLSQPRGAAGMAMGRSLCCRRSDLEACRRHDHVDDRCCCRCQNSRGSHHQNRHCRGREWSGSRR